MAKKKKGGKDKKEDGDEPGIPKLDPEAVQPYLIQIDSLQEQVAELKHQRNDFEDKNKSLHKEMETIKTDRHDIIMYLNAQLTTRDNRIRALENDRDRLEEEKTEMQKEFEEQMRQTKEDSDKSAKEMTDRIEKLKADLSDLNEFIEKKASMDEELKGLNDLLMDERADHRLQVEELERRHVQEKDKMLKDYMQKLRDTKHEMLKKTDDRLEITTKRTIAENEQMSSELAFQSKHTERLIQKNDRLGQENSALKRKLELFKQTEEELTKRNFIYQKTIRTLLTKIKTLEGSTQYVKEKAAQGEFEHQTKIAETEDETVHLKSRVETLEFQLQMVSNELDHTRNKVQEALNENDRYARCIALQDEVTKFVVRSVEAIRNKELGDLSDGQGHDSVLGLDNAKGADHETILIHLFQRLKENQEIQRAFLDRNETPNQSSGGMFPPINPRAESATSKPETPWHHAFLASPPPGVGGLHPGALSGQQPKEAVSTGTQTISQHSTEQSIYKHVPSKPDVKSDVRPWGPRLPSNKTFGVKGLTAY